MNGHAGNIACRFVGGVPEMLEYRWHLSHLFTYFRESFLIVGQWYPALYDFCRQGLAAIVATAYPFMYFLDYLPLLGCMLRI